MKNFFARLQKIEEYAVAVLLALMVLDIFVATVCRYTGIIAVPWAEEVSRYLMIWIVFIGAGAVASEGGHFGVDIVVSALPRLGRKACHIIQNVVVVFFCVFVAYYGSQNILAQKNTNQLSPALQIPIWMMYLSVVIGVALVLAQYTYNTVKAVRQLSAAEETGKEGA